MLAEELQLTGGMRSDELSSISRRNSFASTRHGRRNREPARHPP